MLALAGADVLSMALGLGAVFGGIGYAAGQFISSRRRALGDSLSTALDEVNTYKSKTDRLAAEVRDLRAEVVELRETNKILKESIASGAHIAPAIEAAMHILKAELERVAREEHAKTRAMIGGRN